MMTSNTVLRSLLALIIVAALAKSALAAYPAETAAGRSIDRTGRAATEHGLIRLAQISIGGGGFQIGVGGSRDPRYSRPRRYRGGERINPRHRRRVRPGVELDRGSRRRRPRGRDRRHVRPRPDHCRSYGRYPSRGCRPGRPWRPRPPVIVITPPPIIEDDEDDHVREPPRRISPPKKTAKPKRPARKPRRRVATSPPPPRVIPPLPAPRPTAVALDLDHWPNEIVVQLANTSPPNTEDALAQAYNLIFVVSETNALVGRRIVKYQFSGQRSAAAVSATLSADARVVGAQPNWRYRVTQGSGTTGRRSAAASLQYAAMKLGLDDAHAIARGRGIKVAVIDSGVDRSHPALANAIAGSFDAAGRRGYEIGAHGTAIAGILKAQGLLKGVAPSADLLAVRAFFATEKGAQEQSSTAIIMRSLDWAVREKARIINMSFAGPPDAAVADAIKAAREKGVILIAAAGNGGPDATPAYPAAYEEVIAVTATDTEDHLYDKANRGPYIDVAAPGVDIFVVAPAKAYTHSSGTSLAAAHVSGIVALLMERDAAIDGGEIGEMLRAASDDLGQPGPDKEFGAGRIDALKLLQARAVKVAVPGTK
jgi:hypothetical protein